MANVRHIASFIQANPFVVDSNNLLGLGADYREIVPFIRKAEGGLSKAKTDVASKNPVPDGSGYHTNKGITWTTLQSYQKALGIKSTAELIRVFYDMPDSVWLMIFRVGYWNPIKGDQIKSQAFASTLADWAYAAGTGAAIKKTQQFFGLPVTYKMDDATLSAINSIQNEAETVQRFSDYKKQWYLTLPNQEANYKGWAARLDSLYQSVSKRLINTVKENPLPVLLGGALVIGTIWLISRNKKKDQLMAA